MSFYPCAAPPSAPWMPSTPSSSSPAPIYVILITGMVLFMASNVMPNLLPAPERIFNVAPRVLFWGFWLILLTLLANMTGTIPGIPQIHLTYVHMTVAALIFVLIWNQLANEIPLPPPDAPSKSSSSSSSSSSREKPKEVKPEKKEEKAAQKISPWDDLRAHPSAFLTTRLNKAAMWPFPMGKAAKVGPELWWESGTPSHVGHFNKPESPPEAKEEKTKKSDDGDKDKEKEREKAKEKEKEKEKLKEAEKAKLTEKEAAEKKKKNDEEMRKAMEAKKTDSGGSSKVDLEAKKAEKDAEERQKQKLWRTKALMMIVGISLLSKSLGFLLLLFFSLQMISQELNGPTPPTSSSQPQTSSSSSSSSNSSSSQPTADPRAGREADKAQMAKMQAMKEAEREEVSASVSGSGSSSCSRDKEKEKEGGKSTSSSSSSSSSSSREKSSSSKDKSELVTSDAVREASGSKTKTNIDGGEGGEGPTPAFLGMGMHYIHTRGFDGKLDDTGSANIPSEGMPHPLMTSFMRGYAG